MPPRFTPSPSATLRLTVLNSSRYVIGLRLQFVNVVLGETDRLAAGAVTGEDCVQNCIIADKAELSHKTRAIVDL